MHNRSNRKLVPVWASGELSAHHSMLGRPGGKSLAVFLVSRTDTSTAGPQSIEIYRSEKSSPALQRYEVCFVSSRGAADGSSLHVTTTEAFDLVDLALPLLPTDSAFAVGFGWPLSSFTLAVASFIRLPLRTVSTVSSTIVALPGHVRFRFDGKAIQRLRNTAFAASS